MGYGKRILSWIRQQRRRQEGGDSVEEHKLFYTAADIAADLSISEGEAGELVKELHRALRGAGKIVIPGKVPVAWYERQKESGFTGTGPPGQIPLTEKRLLSLKEFCQYSGLGRDAAYRFGERAGITKWNGRKVLFDRVLFDRWCDENRGGEL